MNCTLSSSSKRLSIVVSCYLNNLQIPFEWNIKMSNIKPDKKWYTVSDSAMQWDSQYSESIEMLSKKFLFWNLCNLLLSEQL